MIKKCTICKAEYKASPSDKRTTCGAAACVSARRRQMLTGKGRPWGQPARDRRKGLYPDQLANGTAAAQKSPKSGPFETNQEALEWVIISPDGVRHQVRNLNLFARANFGADWRSWRVGMQHVKRSMQGKTQHQISHCRGWTVESWSSQQKKSPRSYPEGSDAEIHARAAKKTVRNGRG